MTRAAASRVLLVNSDTAVLRGLAAALRGERHAVMTARAHRDTLAVAAQHQVDIAVLSTHLHDGGALELGRFLASRHRLGLVFTSHERSLLLEAFDAGADDFMREPVDPLELLVRIRALARRLDLSAHTGYEFGPLQLQPEQHVARANGTVVELTPTEFRLLELFMSHPDTVLSRRRILAKVWASQAISRNTVERHLSTLRSKLQRCGADDVIHTVYGIGYKLTLH